MFWRLMMLMWEEPWLGIRSAGAAYRRTGLGGRQRVRIAARVPHTLGPCIPSRRMILVKEKRVLLTMPTLGF